MITLVHCKIRKRIVKVEYFHSALLHSSLKGDVEVQNNCVKLEMFPYRKNGQLQFSFSLVFFCWFFFSGIEIIMLQHGLYIYTPNEMDGAHCLASPQISSIYSVNFYVPQRAFWVECVSSLWNTTFFCNKILLVFVTSTAWEMLKQEMN